MRFTCETPNADIWKNASLLIFVAFSLYIFLAISNAKLFEYFRLTTTFFLFVVEILDDFNFPF